MRAKTNIHTSDQGPWREERMPFTTNCMVTTDDQLSLKARSKEDSSSKSSHGLMVCSSFRSGMASEMLTYAASILVFIVRPISDKGYNNLHSPTWIVDSI